MFKKLFCSFAAFSLTFAPAFANDGGFTGEAGLNFSTTTGNTETTDIGGSLALEKQTDTWRHKLNGIVDYGEVSGDTNRNRWSLGYQIDRDLNERLYAYVGADTYQDEFGAYKDGYSATTGLGYKAILPEPLAWNLEAGVGYLSQKRRLAPGTIGGAASEREEGIALRGFSDLKYQLNENVSFYNTSEITWSSDDTYIWNDIGVTAQLMGNLAARASFRVDHHTDVAPGFEKTDTATRLGIVYTIK